MKKAIDDTVQGNFSVTARYMYKKPLNSVKADTDSVATGPYRLRNKPTNTPVYNPIDDPEEIIRTSDCS